MRNRIMASTAAAHVPRAVPDHIDEAARQMPDVVWARVTRSSTSLAQGWTEYTFAQLARTVDHVAWWIEETIGVAKRQGEVLGYMGWVCYFLFFFFFSFSFFSFSFFSFFFPFFFSSLLKPLARSLETH